MIGIVRATATAHVGPTNGDAAVRVEMRGEYAVFFTHHMLPGLTEVGGAGVVHYFLRCFWL